MAKLTREALFDEASRLARANNMFVVSAGSDFVLYRKMEHRNVRLGARSSQSALRNLVRRCVGSR